MRLSPASTLLLASLLPNGASAAKSCLEAVMTSAPIGRYPDAAGTVTVCFDADGASTMGTLDMKVTGIAASTTGGVHIHEGTTCDDYGGHFYEPNNGDPWFNAVNPPIAPTGTGYTSDADGTGTASFEFDQGYGYDESLGRTMIVHDTITSLGGDYNGVACGILVAKAMDKPMPADEPVGEEAGDGPGTIVEVAAGDPALAGLAGAVTMGGLADVLSGDGPYTVFAPSNEALQAVQGELMALVAQPEQIQAILKYHVVEGKVMSADVATGSVPTLNGADLDVVVGDDGSVTVGGANVIRADIEASNGVIHMIDAVLMPPAPAGDEDGDETPAADPVEPDPAPEVPDVDAPVEDSDEGDAPAEEDDSAAGLAGVGIAAAAAVVLALSV